jgi:two-component system, chemotaxis family, sensor kinase CheA
MPSDPDRFAERLLATFRAEAEERLAAIADGLARLRAAPSEAERAAIAGSLLRTAHSLKGAARTVNRQGIEDRSQSLESAFAAIAAGTLPVSPPLVDRLFREVDAIHDSVASSGGPRASPASAPEPEAPAETLRVRTDAFDALFAGVLELAPLARGTGRGPFDPVEAELAALEAEVGPHPAIARLRRHCRAGADALLAEREILVVRIDRLVAALQGLLFVPAAEVLEAAARAARDLARREGKEVDVRIAGAEIEADRHLLAALAAPLGHLVANAVVHGIEPPEEREARGKPRRGVLSITLSLLSGHRIAFTVADDGAGIPIERLRRLAVERGLLDEERAGALETDAAARLAFAPGLSTSRLTRHAGRGVGLAAVREEVERVGGEVGLETRPGRGTTVRVEAPIATTTFRGVLVRCGSERLVLPGRAVRGVLRVRPGEAAPGPEGRLHLRRDPPIAALPLAAVLGIRAEPRPDGVAAAVLIGPGEGSAALLVDEVLTEETYLLHPLGPPLRRVRYVAGAAVLGDGTPAPVLHVPDLLRAEPPAAAPAESEAGPAARPARLLVVEDSITARALLRNILRGGGHEVETAADGLEAWQRLQTEPFDLVVSDLDMPRLDGFELTARIRASPRLSALPVVLVTALDAPADRERGLEAGANAFMVKSSVEESDLLEVVARLL